MPRKFTTSFDELIRNYYGKPDRAGLKDSMTVEELLANYYGNASVGAEERKKLKLTQVMSLSPDNGEILRQRRRRRARSRYGYQQSVDAGFEEYVVTNGVATTQSVRAMSVETPAVDTPNVHEEYAIDILAPLPESSTARPSPVTEGNGSSAKPAPVLETPAKDVAREEFSRAKVTDDDILKDLEAIIKGEKAYDQRTKTMVPKDAFSAAQSTASGLPAPQAGDGQAIFDRIAQSMSYANAYDLGTVELENRFADFDRMSELQRKSEQTHKPKPQYAQSYSAATVPAVKSADFIEDLDAIRRQSEGGGSSVSIAEAMSAAAVEELNQSDREPVCRPWALSLSDTDDPNDYSRPLYDAGEHVMAGWDLYTDQLHVGPSPGVLFSYGQLIAMGDLYANNEMMMKAPLVELRGIKIKLDKSKRYYEGGARDRGLDVGDSEWVEVVGDSYLELAKKNYEHFAPNDIYKNEPWVSKLGINGNNRTEWKKYHTRAIVEAQKLLLAAPASTPPFLESALIINGFGDHFLTDAFAAGHMVNKEAAIEMFKYNFYNGKSLKPAAEKFFERVAKAAFKDEVARRFSELETFDPVILWWNPNINSASRFAGLLTKIAEQAPDEIANLAVKALHDNLNKHGVEVTNDAGDGVWRLTGDGLLDAKNLQIIKKAVQQSVDNIIDPANRTNVNIPAAIDRVWKHVPRLTDPGKAQVRTAANWFTTPESDRLVDATAELIKKKLDILINELTAKKKLKRA